ncbi:SusC/RagA family TonB-linked outer membrane protein [Myxococcaceae bacterium GXIMD 01537]
MSLKRALIPGCALALLAMDTWAQEAQQQPPAAADAPVAQQPAPISEVKVQTRTVKGRVLDGLTREGLPLVRVIIKGTRHGVETETDGSFSLPGVPMGATTLLISSQDYKDREVVVKADQSELSVALENSFVEEMVVVGRASELARKHLANSVASVQAEEVNRTPVQTVDQALQGKIAGANIQQNSGAPGGGLQLRLRGVSTINGETAPLYVIDGVIVSDAAVASGIFAVTESVRGSNPSATQDNQVNRVADLNPNDIESIEVLKGASAAAIYGSKAANGVVIITTKRGRGGEPTVSLTQRLGFFQLANKLGLRQFGSVEEAVEHYGPKAADYFQPGKSYDHEQELAGRSPLSNETLASVSGSSGNTRYFASAMVKNDEGIIANTGYEKQSFRLNLGQKLGDTLEVTASANLLHTLGQRGLTNNDNTGITYHMVMPYMPSFFNAQAGADGLYPKNPFLGSAANALQTADLMRNDEDVWRLIGSTDATWRALQTDNHDLKVLANFGVDRFQQENSLFFPPELTFEQAAGTPGASLFGTTQVYNLNGGANVVHSYRPSDRSLSATTSAGVQFEERALDSVYVVSRNLNAGQQNVNSGTDVNVRQNRTLVRDRGYYVQEEVLALEERLTLVGALRGEQSSANGNQNALFFYPKLAGAYRLTPFHDAINEFKVRLAYGETGNLPRYGQKFSALQAINNVQGNPGLVGSGIAGSPDIRPERQRELEAGVDLLMFGGRMVAELSIYQRNISDLLLQRALPPSTGFTTQIFNGGALRNRGVEAMLQVTPVRGDLEWTSAATFALNRSLVTDLPVPSFLAGGFGTGLGAFRIEEGASATQIVGNSGLREDGTCCVVKKVGDTEPDFRMSFTNTLRYGQFSMSFLLDWQQGSDVINLTRFIYDDAGASPDYTTAGKQRLADQATNAGVYVEDASFLKLREVTVSYQLPERAYSWIPRVKSARWSISGRNLLTLTGYSGLDPEVSNFGNQAIARNIDVAPFPPSRSFWTSLDVGF